MKPWRELARACVPGVDSRLFVAKEHGADLLGDPLGTRGWMPQQMRQDLAHPGHRYGRFFPPIARRSKLRNHNANSDSVI
jgi:hypothetical protein